MRFGKPDASAKAIDDWMAAHGASIMKLDGVGGGWPDRLYGIRGVNVLAELKSEGGKVSPKQVERALHWKGQPIHVWKTPEDAQKTLRERYGLNV